MANDSSTKRSRGYVPSGTTEITQSPDGWIVRLSGALGYDVKPLQRELEALLAKRPPVVWLDLGGLTMISSVLLGALVDLRRTLIRNGGQLKTRAAAPLVRDVFRRVSLANLFGMDELPDPAPEQP